MNIQQSGATGAALDRTRGLRIEVTRGTMVESRHRGSGVVVDAAGKMVAAWGDVEQRVYPRSAIKPLQALPLIESGAADRWNLSPAELSIACASHGGEPVHVACVTAWLARIGLSVGDLECGPQWPSHETSTHALLRAGGEATAAHNNCSGKHTGFLSVAQQMGWPTRGYIAADHPLQKMLFALFQELTARALDDGGRGVDGCGIPVFGVPLDGLARAMAQLADPSKLAPSRITAVERIRRAVAAEPVMIAGTGRLCTAINRQMGLRALVKTGAEGVYMAALPTRGWGLALKIDDGAGRAAEVALLAILDHLGLLEPADRAALAASIEAPILNRAGVLAGHVRPARDIKGF